MKRLADLGNVFGFHPGIRRIDLAGFAGSQVDHRMGEDRYDEHQHETLEHVAKDKGLHPWLSLETYCLPLGEREFSSLTTTA